MLVILDHKGLLDILDLEVIKVTQEAMVVLIPGSLLILLQIIVPEAIINI